MVTHMLYIIYTCIQIAHKQDKIKRVKKFQINKNKFNSIKFTIMYIANITSRVFRKFLLLRRVNQYNHFLLRVFGVIVSWTYINFKVIFGI